ncbi:MAG: UvrB/UvrC motif-containing protein [Defluviitaleaceae bacterium]|nr:UvrB/UvrC motif-containing protein [Defluviitaleaceae bacterium]
MLCQKCNTNAASVHMQQFMNGQKVELHLCQDCAFKAESSDILFSLENIFKSLMDHVNPQYLPPGGAVNKQRPSSLPVKACSRCGMTFRKFKTGGGRLGCDACYKSFAVEVEVLLRTMQGSTRHEGKYPRRTGAGILSRRQVSDLRGKLKNAVELEDFEEAARLRDEIRALDKSTEVQP